MAKTYPSDQTAHATAAASYPDNPTVTNTDDCLSTPATGTHPKTHIHVSWSMNLDPSINGQAYGTVYYSTNGGGSWSALVSHSGLYNSGGSDDTGDLGTVDWSQIRVRAYARSVANTTTDTPSATTDITSWYIYSEQKRGVVVF